MELNVEAQTSKLQMEITQLTGQLQQLDNQIAQLNQARNNQVATILKKQGALEHLQGMEKPDEAQ